MEGGGGGHHRPRTQGAVGRHTHGAGGGGRSAEGAVAGAGVVVGGRPAITLNAS